jgi:hypothetical protein
MPSWRRMAQGSTRPSEDEQTDPDALRGNEGEQSTGSSDASAEEPVRNVASGLSSGRLAGAAGDCLARLGAGGHDGDGGICLLGAQMAKFAAAQRQHCVPRVEDLLAAVHADLVGLPLDGEGTRKTVVAAETEDSLEDRLKEFRDPAHGEAPRR